MNEQNETPRSRWIWVAVGLWVVVGACQGFFDSFGAGPTGPVFPHDKHIEEMDCADCHEGAEEGGPAGYPATTNGCMLCHKEIDAKLPPERRVSAFLVDGEPRWLKRGTPYTGDIRFSHAAHYDAELECESCHQPQTGGEGPGLRIRGGKTTCMKCHENTPKKNDCAVCHAVLRRDELPPDHLVNWKRAHGVHSREVIPGTGETTCIQCHQQKSCDVCHQIEPPRNHSNSWRRGRGHGLASSIDRSSCVTCHSTDYCDRCHKTTQPRSHRGAFGAPRNRHCVSCHVAPEGQGCGACHRQFPGHSPGPRLPGNTAHLSATSPVDCLTCHIALKHANPGLDCRVCHK